MFFNLLINLLNIWEETILVEWDIYAKIMFSVRKSWQTIIPSSMDDEIENEKWKNTQKYKKLLVVGKLLKRKIRELEAWKRKMKWNFWERTYI